MGGGSQGPSPMAVEGEMETGDAKDDEGGSEEEGDQEVGGEHEDLKEVQAKLQEEFVKTWDDLGHMGWGSDQGPKDQDFSRYVMECCDIGLALGSCEPGSQADCLPAGSF